MTPHRSCAEFGGSNACCWRERARIGHLLGAMGASSTRWPHYVLAWQGRDTKRSGETAPSNQRCPVPPSPGEAAARVGRRPRTGDALARTRATGAVHHGRPRKVSAMPPVPRCHVSQAGPPAEAGARARDSSTTIPAADLVPEEPGNLRFVDSPPTEGGVGSAVASRWHERWLADNSDALDSSNEFVERHGLPLARYRRF
jgi:antitoxin CcdA